jgi:shikimate kinase
MKVFLLGYMGSGKTTAGKKLAKALNLDFFDLDEVIEQQQKMSVNEIFDNFGEEKFRWLERNALKKTIITLSQGVIATGGGTPCFMNNIQLMNNSGITVYLKLNEKALFDRLINAKKTRPLIKSFSEKELENFILSQLSKRKDYYEQSKLIVDGVNLDIISLAENIKTLNTQGL